MTAEAAASPDSTEPGAGGGRRGLWIALALLVLAGGGGAAAWFGGFIGKGETAAGGQAAQKPPLYFTLDDNLVVNFRKGGGARYLEVGIELMTREPATLEALKTQTPVIRNNLILLLGDQTYETLATREGKEALRAAALAEVRSALGETGADPGVESLYFTTFVMQ
ncbi:MAG TPA: flagellar basal body-associated FliL family protein [Gammaproteobacteria bacterium]|nr:flagellar basal body-associated FliL family protein [Gammaproteobacteria bacterium]